MDIWSIFDKLETELFNLIEKHVYVNVNFFFVKIISGISCVPE